MLALTQESATSFERFSIVNAATLEAVGCGCKAYVDWFTYKRWAAQHMQVKRGEHGTRITTYVQTTRKDRDGVDRPPGSFPRTTVVFCRHQVEPYVMNRDHTDEGETDEPTA